MNDRDDELKKILRPLKDLTPNDFQMQSWQRAVNGEVHKTPRQFTTTRSKWALQLMAAMFVGVVIGAVLFKMIQPPAAHSPLVAQNSSDDATFERSHANLD